MLHRGELNMAKKSVKKEEVVEKGVEEKPTVIVDKHGYKWEVNSDGKKLKRL